MGVWNSVVGLWIEWEVTCSVLVLNPCFVRERVLGFIFVGCCCCCLALLQGCHQCFSGNCLTLPDKCVYIHIYIYTHTGMNSMFCRWKRLCALCVWVFSPDV